MNISNIKPGMEVKNYKELCSLLEIKAVGGKSKILQMEKISKYIDFKKEGNKFLIEKVTIPTVEEEPKARKDKGVARGSYNSLRNQLKPLIYSLVLNNEGKYTGSFNNWLEYTKLVSSQWKYEKGDFFKKANQEKSLEDFLRIEGRSLNYLFKATLEEMEKEGAIKVEEVRIGVTDIRDVLEELGIGFSENDPEKVYHIYKGAKKKKIDKIEEDLLKNKYGVDSIWDLAYGNKKLGIKRNLHKLLDFKFEFNSIIWKKFQINICYRATEVKIADKRKIKKFKEQYGITEDMENVTKNAKNEIYKSRKNKANKRFSKPVEEAKNGWYGDANMIEKLEKEKEEKLKIWDDYYKIYIL